MSPGVLAYLAGMLLLFVGQRILDGLDLAQTAVTVVGALGLAAAAVLRVRSLRAAKDPGLRMGHRYALILLMVGVGSVVLYAGTTESFTQGLTLDDEGEARWLGLTRSAWPVVWLLGTIPLLVVDYAVYSSPVVVPIRRIRESVVHGLVVAMGLAMVFPLNYVSTKRNERWDLAYFKTPTPGTATQALVEALEEPVTVRIFMPPSSEVATELRNYFAPLEGPKLSVEIIDQAANPQLAKALTVRDNGTVAITQGDVSALMDSGEPELPHGDHEGEQGEEAADDTPKPVTRRLSINPEIDKAKKTLKTLDAEVQKMLIELGQGERVAYFTTGHGELNWSSQQKAVDLTIKAMRSRMMDLGFTIKPLGATQGLGDEVPEDASVVLVLGPQSPFFQDEVDALRAFLERGGSLVIAREPEGPREIPNPLDDLMAELGVRKGEGILASEINTKRLFGNVADRINILTDGFSSHATTDRLADRANQLILFTPTATYLEEVPEHDNSLLFVVRSRAESWADLDGKLQFEADAGESKEARNLVAVIEGGAQGNTWRAMVTSDATMFTDLGVGLNMGNRVFVEDTINWLIGAEALSGTTGNEEDVKIEHSKEGQQWWFYLTVLIVPLGVIVLGAMRIRLRHKGGKA